MSFGSSRGEIEEMNQDDRHVAADLTSQTAVADSSMETQLMRAKPIQQSRVTDARVCFGSSNVDDGALKRGAVEERKANMEYL